MTTEVQVMSVEQGAAELESAHRPVRVNEKTGVVQIQHARGFYVNSMLRKDEWVAVDAAVTEAARYPLRAVSDLRARNLVQPLGGIGTLVTQWYTSSGVDDATVNMTGTGGSRDRIDLKQAGVPVPVVFKDFEIDARSLASSRRMGDGIDVTTAVEAARVVAEKLESLLVDGITFQLNGQSLYGYTTQPNRNTDTASNFGGGDWSTVANIVPTVKGIINAAMGDNHYGPYVLYASTTQFNEASLVYYDDGSSDTPYDRVLRMPQISAFQMLPELADGNLLLIQMDRTVVEWAEAIQLQVREWMSNDGMSNSFKVLAVAAPKVKARYDGKSGIVHATGA